jgi:hypothetical protein
MLLPWSPSESEPELQQPSSQQASPLEDPEALTVALASSDLVVSSPPRNATVFDALKQEEENMQRGCTLREYSMRGCVRRSRDCMTLCIFPDRCAPFRRRAADYDGCGAMDKDNFREVQFEGLRAWIGR